LMNGGITLLQVHWGPEGLEAPGGIRAGSIPACTGSTGGSIPRRSTIYAPSS